LVRVLEDSAVHKDTKAYTLMIACKAPFALLLLLLGTTAASGHPSFDYPATRLFAYDVGTPDYSQRLLSENVRFLLFRAEFKVRQTGYANSSGNLANLQIATNFAALASFGLAGIAPADLDRDLYNAERFTVRLYESLARRWERLNPIPGLLYEVVIRSPAYPFIFLEGLDAYWFDLGTFPFTDDLRFRQVSLASRQYAFGFRISF
jgi:hypothetical protein